MKTEIKYLSQEELNRFFKVIRSLRDRALLKVKHETNVNKKAVRRPLIGIENLLYISLLLGRDLK